MKEKEKQIIEAAIKLFATKGFNGTSIQEIATEAGISKGAFYLYFKSKDALLLAILKYYTERMYEKVQSIEDEPLDPREKFQKQLHCLFEEIQQQREFIIMQMREQAVPFNKDIERFIRNKRIESHQFYYKSLHSIYGEEIDPYIWDLTLILQGIFHAYFELIIFDMTHFDFKQLSAFILNRADDLVKGLSKSTENPILSKDIAKRFTNFDQKGIDKGQIIRAIQDIGNTQLENDENVMVTLDVIKSEMEKDSPRIPVIQGMLSNLKSIPELNEIKEKIVHFYELKSN